MEKRNFKADLEEARGVSELYSDMISTYFEKIKNLNENIDSMRSESCDYHKIRKEVRIRSEIQKLIAEWKERRLESLNLIEKLREEVGKL